MTWGYLLLFLGAVSVCGGSTSPPDQCTCTNTFHFDQPFGNYEAVLTKLRQLLEVTQTVQSSVDEVKRELTEVKQEQGDLKTHILKRLDAQDRKLELSLTSSQQEVQQDGIAPTRQPAAATNVTDPKNCREVLDRGSSRSGVYTISPDGVTKIKVYCEQQLDGGGWTVFQRRQNGSVNVNFYRTWSEYKRGFGDLAREFWLGNDNIHLLTKDYDQRLKVELTRNHETAYADYSGFFVGNEDERYKLNVTGYSGASPPGDCFRNHNQSYFSTKDRDNDRETFSRAQQMKGGWWYRDTVYCNLNGVHGGTVKYTHLFWFLWKLDYVPMTATRMMVRTN